MNLHRRIQTSIGVGGSGAAGVSLSDDRTEIQIKYDSIGQNHRVGEIQRESARYPVAMGELTVYYSLVNNLMSSVLVSYDDTQSGEEVNPTPSGTKRPSIKLQSRKLRKDQIETGDNYKGHHAKVELK